MYEAGVPGCISTLLAIGQELKPDLRIYKDKRNQASFASSVAFGSLKQDLRSTGQNDTKFVPLQGISGTVLIG